MGLQIGYLSEHPAYILPLAQWHHAQWSYLCPRGSVAKRVAQLQTHVGSQIPTTFVATADKTLVGSASLITHDMDTRMALSPWLASVYVTPDRRRQGIGTHLVRRVIEEAKVLGVETLYLYTPDKEQFYTRRGWSVLERTRYRGYDQVAMCFDVQGHRQTPL